MVLGKVIGTVVSTVKHDDYLGHKLYVIQPLDSEQCSSGETFLAIDTVQSGVGDTVLVMREGNGVRQILRKEICCVRSLVVGVVDEVDVPEVHRRGPAS